MTAAPFTVETLDTWGRVLVATRDIAPWELVLEDTCIATVPNDVPVCLGSASVRCEVAAIVSQWCHVAPVLRGVTS